MWCRYRDSHLKAGKTTYICESSGEEYLILISNSNTSCKQRAEGGICNVVGGRQRFSHCLLWQTSWLADHTMSRPPPHPPDNVDVALLGAD